MKTTRLDGRRTQHIGVLSEMWAAHDRGLGDNGVPASTTTTNT